MVVKVPYTHINTFIVNTSSPLLAIFLNKCTDLIIPQYIDLNSQTNSRNYCYKIYCRNNYDVNSLSLDKNHTFIGSDFPFIETGPLYSKRNCGS